MALQTQYISGEYKGSFADPPSTPNHRYRVGCGGLLTCQKVKASAQGAALYTQAVICICWKCWLAGHQYLHEPWDLGPGQQQLNLTALKGPRKQYLHYTTLQGPWQINYTTLHGPVISIYTTLEGLEGSISTMLHSFQVSWQKCFYIITNHGPRQH